MARSACSCSGPGGAMPMMGPPRMPQRMQPPMGIPSHGYSSASYAASSRGGVNVSRIADEMHELRDIGILSSDPDAYDADGDCMPLNATTISAVSIDEYSESIEPSGCPPCDEQIRQSKTQEAIQLAEEESNVTVYDVEDLNETSPPRNLSLDIPRRKLWQMISAYVEDIEEEEVDEYNEFLEEFQSIRRENMESTRLSQA